MQAGHDMRWPFFGKNKPKPDKLMDRIERATRKGRPDLITADLAELVRIAPQDFKRAAQLGEHLFVHGYLNDAYTWLLDVFERHGASSDTAPLGLDHSGLARLAALADHKGNPALAARCQKAMAKNFPLIDTIRQTTDTQPGSRVLRIRPLSDCRYVVRGTHQCHASLTGGMMAVDGFLDQDHFPHRTLNLHREEHPSAMLRDQLADQTKVIVNSIACADTHGALLSALAKQETSFPIPMINPPSAILRTSRRAISKIMADIVGLASAPLVAFDTSDELSEARRSGLIDFPMILRRRDTHTGKSVELIDDQQGLDRYFQHYGEHGPYYAIGYVDIRSDQEQRTGGVFHKYRAFFIDRTLFPIARVTSDAWQIHSGDRYRIMEGIQTYIDMEKTWLKDPIAAIGSPAVNGLKALSEALDMDFFGVDFALLPDGRAFVFEANPAMRHNFDHVDAFPHTKAPLQAASDAFQAMVKKRMEHAH